MYAKNSFTVRKPEVERRMYNAQTKKYEMGVVPDSEFIMPGELTDEQVAMIAPEEVERLKGLGVLFDDQKDAITTHELPDVDLRKDTKLPVPEEDDE